MRSRSRLNLHRSGLRLQRLKSGTTFGLCGFVRFQIQTLNQVEDKKEKSHGPMKKEQKGGKGTRQKFDQVECAASTVLLLHSWGKAPAVGKKPIFLTPLKEVGRGKIQTAAEISIGSFFSKAKKFWVAHLDPQEKR